MIKTCAVRNWGQTESDRNQRRKLQRRSDFIKIFERKRAKGSQRGWRDGLDEWIMFLISRWNIKSSFQQDRLQYKKEEVELERGRWGMNCLKPDESWRKWWEENLFFSVQEPLTEPTAPTEVWNWCKSALYNRFLSYIIFVKPFPLGVFCRMTGADFSVKDRQEAAHYMEMQQKKQRWRGYFRHLGLQLHLKWIIIIRTDKGRWLTAGRLSRPKYV